MRLNGNDIHPEKAKLKCKVDQGHCIKYKQTHAAQQAASQGSCLATSLRHSSQIAPPPLPPLDPTLGQDLCDAGGHFWG